MSFFLSGLRSRRILLTRIFGSIISLFLLLGISACNDFLDVGAPSTQLVGATAYENKSSAESVLVSIYAEMMGASQTFASGGASSISTLAGLSSDEFVDGIIGPNNEQIAFQTNSLLAEDHVITDAIWEPAYKFIYYANSFLEGIQKSTTIDPVDKDHFEGEAKFLRAFIYFYLTNLFGDVPLILSTDYETNSVSGKASSQTIYLQILSDLNEAQLLLPVNPEYKSGRVRPNSYAAKAMLARVYLYLGEWEKAEMMASEVIGATTYYKLDKPENVFTIKRPASTTAREAIWQLMPVSESGLNTYEALFFYSGAVSMTSDLVAAFEPLDQRQQWILTFDGVSYFPAKYNAFQTEKFEEYSMVLRLAEQYLIRAEARARLGGGDNLALAINDLDTIRTRAGLLSIRFSHTGEITQDDLLADIAHERRVELFSEWGHRWFDLKRTGQADVVLGALKGAAWQATDKLYPIPAAEIVRNPSLAPQNLGY